LARSFAFVCPTAGRNNALPESLFHHGFHGWKIRRFLSVLSVLLIRQNRSFWRRFVRGMFVRGMGQGVRKMIPLTNIPLTPSASPENKMEGKNGRPKDLLFLYFCPHFFAFLFPPARTRLFECYFWLRLGRVVKSVVVFFWLPLAALCSFASKSPAAS
jgi:hypothetical protein